MARVTRLVIGEDNFNDAACGFSFKASVCEPTEEIDDTHIRVRRLLALFPGSTVETVLSKPAPKEPEKKADAKPDAPKAEAGAKPDSAPKPVDAPDPTPDDLKKKAEDAPGPVPGQKPDHLPEESPAEPKKPSTVGEDDAEVTAKLQAAAAEDHAVKTEAEAQPVKASDETSDELPAVEGSEKPCGKCGQVDHGQQGEYPCSQCGLPTLHDEKAPEAESAEEADDNTAATAPDGK